MRSVNKRIFIGNLPPDINEIDINRKFSSYGKINSIDIKQRKEGLNKNVSPIFAFVNIEIDDRTLNKCFREFDYNWNGYEVKLEVAKESFLERLKREREEENIKKDVEVEIETIEHNNVPSVDKNLYKKTYYSSSSDSSSESEEQTIPVKKQVELKAVKSQEQIKCNVSNGKLIQADNKNYNEPIATLEKNKINMKDKKAQEAEEKRKKSLDLMKSSYMQQKSIIKSALSNVDSRRNNKIIFDDETVEKVKNSKKRKNHENDVEENESKKTRVSLFQDDSDDEQINFGIKNQFEGKSGQKLLELQSRFTSDKRFTLDSRFLDTQEQVEEIETNEITEDDEKQKQFEILESVLGQKVVGKKPKEIENKESNKLHKTMLRYDPSKSEHSKFESKDQNKKERKKKKNQEESPVEETKIEVSKDTFQIVSDNLKFTEEKEPFSLLSMFGRVEEDNENEDKEKDEAKEIHITQNKFGHDRNPFKYDSSDSEDEDQTFRNKEKTINKNEMSKNNYVKSFKKETFFFQNNDERLQEAGEFLKRLNNQTCDKPFNEKRRELKKIVKDKIKNNQRNHRPFRRKLGMHKMIKVKKARQR